MPMDRTAFERFISTMHDAPVIGVDTETNKEDVRDGRGYCVGISVAYRVGDLGIFTAYFPFRHESQNLPMEWLEELKAVLEPATITCHNAKFDVIQSLKTLGINHRGKFYCSQVMAHLVNENWPSKELDWLSKTLLGDPGKDDGAVKTWEANFGWASIPGDLMAPYACKDAELHLRLFEYLFPEFVGQELDKVWPEEVRFITNVGEIEKVGVKVDRNKLESLAEFGEIRMEEIVEELGWTPSKTKELSHFLLTELGLPVVKTTKPSTRFPQGQPSFDKGAMEEYELHLERLGLTTAQLVLEYRGWQQACSFWYNGWLRFIGPDGRLRPNYKIHGTKTGRVSSELPNMQQIPRKGVKPWNGQVKSCLIPDPGWKLIEFDYKTLEFRIGAAYAGEEQIISDFNNGYDVHASAAERLFGKVDDELRYKAKTINFATIYGAGQTRMALLLKMEEYEVEPILNLFHETYPGFRRVAKAAADKARATGFVRYWTGRRRHFPAFPGNYHKAFNSIIQGGGAELVKHSLNRCMDNVVDDNCKLVLQIHDSLVFLIREDLVEDYKAKIIPLMEDFPMFGVKMEVDAHEWAAA